MELEALEFFDLWQLIKTLDKPYMQVFRTGEKKAIYYEICPGSCRDVFVFCTSEFYPFEFLKVSSSGVITGVDDNVGTNCIALAHVKNDSLLMQILEVPKLMAKEMKKKKLAAQKKKKVVAKRKSV
jgi:inorganic pyrophosphatase